MVVEGASGFATREDGAEVSVGGGRKMEEKRETNTQRR